MARLPQSATRHTVEPIEMKKLALSLAVIAVSGVYILNRPLPPRSDLNSLAGQPLPTTEGPATVAPSTLLPANASARFAAAAPAPAPAAPQPALKAPPAVPRQEPDGTRHESLRIADLAPPAIDPPAPAAPAEPPTTAADKPRAPVPPPRPEGLAAAPSAPPTQPTSPSGNTVTRVAASGYRDGAFTGPVTNAYYGLMQVRATVRDGRLVAVDILRFPSDRRRSVFINRVALPILRDEVVQAQSSRVDIVSGATLSSRAFIASLDHALQDARA